MLEPVSDPEILQFALLLIRVFATERSKYWGAALRSRPAGNIFKNRGWRLEITRRDGYVEYDWRWHVQDGTNKLFLFVRENTVVKAAIASRDEAEPYTWHILLCDFTRGSVLRHLASQGEMEDDADALLSNIKDDHPEFTPLSRNDFAMTFGLLLPDHIVPEAHAIVGFH